MRLQRRVSARSPARPGSESDTCPSAYGAYLNGTLFVNDVGMLLLTRNIKVDDVFEDSGRLLEVVSACLREEAVRFRQAFIMRFITELRQATHA